MDGKFGADDLCEGKEGAGDVHGVVDIPVPQLEHDAPPLLLVSWWA